MKSYLKQIAVLSGLLALLAGCEKASDKAASGRASTAGEPVLSVDGAVLTRGEIDAHVGLMLSFLRGGTPSVTPQRVKSVCEQLEKTYPDLFIQKKLIREYADRERVTVPDETLREFQKRSMRKARHLKVRTYGDFLKKLGSRAALFDEMVRSEALEAMVRDHVVAANPTNLPAGYGAQKLAEIKAFNKQMDATNAVIHARAREAWGKLRAGVPFETVVADYTELEDERNDKGDWGVLDHRLLDGFPALSQAVAKLNVGEFSEPVEGDNGLLIVRLDAKDVEKDEFALSRIYFRLPMFLAELSPDELVKLTKKEHAERVWNETLAAWRKNAKVEYFRKAEVKKAGVNRKTGPKNSKKKGASK